MGSIKGQKHNPYLEGRYAHINPNDVVFTPDWLAKQICVIQAIEYVIEGAKAKLPMEKEQIIKAVLDGYRSHPYMAEQYYNETYNK
jgi:hypothetical protein